MKSLCWSFLGLIALCGNALAEDRPPVVVADFEGDDYGDWVATGEAFGSAPARGTLPGQMKVSGFLGRGLVNSFVGGDRSTGTLISPEFTLQRPFLNFLIGGGKHPEATYIELLVEGSARRLATGPNDRPGGAERLDWASWDVREFVGKTVMIRIVDSHQGGWGHINVDQIVQEDHKRANEPATRTSLIEKRYLHLPVANDAPVRRLTIKREGTPVRDLDVKLAEGDAAFWVSADVGEFRGLILELSAILPSGSRALEAIRQADELPDEAGPRQESNRPLFHFTSRRGWLNDPNGLVFFKGEYHLFYQHNPYGWDWGNMHWGHAVSKDLTHWKELGDALVPRAYGDWCFSGSAVVDDQNTSGFGPAGSSPLVAAFTSTGRGECVVFSNDQGRTWSEFDGNPVVKHQGRDPRLLWHEPTRRWIMALYDEAEGKRWITFHSSPDLKAWTYESRIEGFYECPDLFRTVVRSGPARETWVLYGADGEYLLGAFDGHTFTPSSGPRQRLWHGDFYAAQTFSNMPDGRVVQIGWGRGVTFPGMPFNQQMTIPVELTIHADADGDHMRANPVAELAKLRGRSWTWNQLGAEPDVASAMPEGYELILDAEVPSGSALSLDLGGTPLAVDARKGTLAVGKVVAPLKSNGHVALHVFVDRGSVEVFANGGRVAVSAARAPFEKRPALHVKAEGGAVELRSATLHELKSSWR